MQKINFTSGKLYNVGGYLTIELYNGFKTVYRGIVDKQQAQELRNNPKVTDLTTNK